MTRTTTGASLDHAIGGDGIVSIRLRDGDVRVRAVDGEILGVRDRSGRDLESAFVIELAEGSASLSADRDADGLGGRRRGHAPDLEIDVPRRATILIESTSAEIKADGLLGDQRYRTTSGEIMLRAVAGRIDIEAVSGDVDIIAVGDVDATLRTVSGDIGLRAATLRSFVAATTSGDLKIAGRLAGAGPFGVETVSGDALIAPAGDLRVEMTTMSGDLRSDVEARAVEGDRGHWSLSIGTGGPLLTFRSMSGDLRVVRPTAIVAPATPTAEPTARPNAAPAAPETNGAIALAYDDARLRILRSLERGEIDVTEAGRRLEALDEADPSGAGPSAGIEPDEPNG